MIKGIPHDANRLLRAHCLGKSHDLRAQGLKGIASQQQEIRRIADRIVDYALHPGTSPGWIEVLFPDKPWKGMKELYLQCPTKVAFRNFESEKKDDIDQHTLLVQHLIVVTNWSSNIKLFKATIDNERLHLMIYTEVTTSKI